MAGKSTANPFLLLFDNHNASGPITGLDLQHWYWESHFRLWGTHVEASGQSSLLLRLALPLRN